MSIDLSNIDLMQIIFEQILKVQPTGNFQADFLNLIFFPHIVIAIWLFLISKAPIFYKGHKGLGILLSVGIYVFIIYYGWYSVIASLSVFWLGATIFISFFYFIFPKIVHPSVTSSRMKLGESVMKNINEKREITKAIERLYDDLKELEKKKEFYLDRYGKEKSEEAMKAINTIDMKIVEVKSKIRELEQKRGWL